MLSDKVEAVDDDQDSPSPILGGWTAIARRQLNVTHTHLFPPNGRESRDIFRRLEDEIVYLTGEYSQIRVYGKFHPLPRKQVGYGDLGITYRFGFTFSSRR